MLNTLLESSKKYQDIKNAYFFEKLKPLVGRLDIPLLMFLLVLSQESLMFKLAAVGLIYLFSFDFSFGLKNNRLPLFYLIIPGVEIIKYFLMGNQYLGNISTISVSIVYWVLSFLCIHQMKLSVEKGGVDKVSNTLTAFTVINFAFTLTQLFLVMRVTHSINPYVTEVWAPDIRYPEILHPYGHSSGDHMRGIFYDHHLNAITCQFLFVFFLFRKKYVQAFANLFLIAIMCFNLVTLLTLIVLGVSFFIVRDKKFKLFNVFSGLFVLAFYLFVTPDNLDYLRSRIDSTYVSMKEDKEVELLIDQNPARRVAALREKNALANASYTFDKVSGKKIAYAQTINLIKSNPVYGIFGVGAGMFSSKMADNFSGVYGQTALSKRLSLPSYKLYLKNHGSIQKDLQNIPIGYHSLNNYPNSVYNQLITEYGLLGLAIFIVFYLGYFLKQYRNMRYSFYLIPLLLIYFNYRYLFESLDVVILFELLFFSDLVKKTVVSK